MAFLPNLATTLAKSRFDASDILARIVFYTIMLFVLSTAFGVFGTNPISDYLRVVIAYLPLVFVAILSVVIASAIAAGAKALIQTSLPGLSYGKLLANPVSGLILALGAIAALKRPLRRGDAGDGPAVPPRALAHGAGPAGGAEGRRCAAAALVGRRA